MPGPLCLFSKLRGPMGTNRSGTRRNRHLGIAAIGALTPPLLGPCLAGVLLLVGCDSREAGAPSADQKDPSSAAIPPAVAGESMAEANAALAEFKASTNALVEWLDERSNPSAKNPPPAPAAMMAEFMGKAKAIETAGLPADLAQAWSDFIGQMTEVDALFGLLPAPNPADPKAQMAAMSDIQPKLMALAEKVRPLVKILADAGRRHGIENLERLGPGGEPPKNPPSTLSPPNSPVAPSITLPSSAPSPLAPAAPVPPTAVPLPQEVPSRPQS